MQFAQRPARAWALFGVMGQAYTRRCRKREPYLIVHSVP